VSWFVVPNTVEVFEFKGTLIWIGGFWFVIATGVGEVVVPIVTVVKFEVIFTEPLVVE